MRGLPGHNERAAPSLTPRPPGPSAFVDACRRAGLRLTPRRQALLRVFDDAQEPICVETYHERLRAQGLQTSRSNLYKLIADLLEAGVLTETLCRDRRRYLPADRA